MIRDITLKTRFIKYMKYCKKCVYPIATVNLEIDEDGICSSCKTFEAFKKIPDDVWKKKRKIN